MADDDENEGQRVKTKGSVLYRMDGEALDPYDLKRLHAYSNNLVDYHLIISSAVSPPACWMCGPQTTTLSGPSFFLSFILDLLSVLSANFFRGKIPVTLSYAQAAFALGCRGKNSLIWRQRLSSAG